MNRANWWMALIGIGLVLVGIWGAWVPHGAAALVLSSWDLAEFVKFVPRVTVIREFFYLPVWCAGITLAVLTIQPTAQPAVRLGLILLALAAMLAILPPYPHVFDGYKSAEFRWRFILGVIGAVVVLAIPLVSRLFKSGRTLSNRVFGGLLLALTLIGTIPALWHFLQVRPAIEQVYGARLGWGWGIGVFLVGWVMVGVAGWRLSTQNAQQ
jgi:hypothetical protein